MKGVYELLGLIYRYGCFDAYGGTTVCRIPLYLSPDRSRAAAERLFSAAAGVCVWKDALGKLFKNYPRKTRGQLFGVV